MRTARRLADECGASAAEFALVAPVAIALVLAAINMGFMMYAGASLHYATQDAARCGAVRSSCSTTTATRLYAESRYKGPSINPVFTPSLTASCSQVNATASYGFTIGIADFAVPLTASACYPLQPTT